LNRKAPEKPSEVEALLIRRRQEELEALDRGYETLSPAETVAGGLRR